MDAGCVVVVEPTDPPKEKRDRDKSNGFACAPEVAGKEVLPQIVVSARTIELWFVMGSYDRLGEGCMRRYIGPVGRSDDRRVV